MSISCPYLAHVLGLIGPKSDPKAGHRLKDEQTRYAVLLRYLGLHEGPVDASLLHDFPTFLQDELTLKRSSQRAYLSSVRSSLRNQLLDGSLRQTLQSLQPEASPAMEQAISDLLIELWKAIDPQSVALPKRTKKPEPGFCPTAEQMQQLFSKYAPTTLQQRRDLLIIAQMALLGLRQAEICALQAQSLEFRDPGSDVLVIPQTTGGTARELSLDKFPVIVQITYHWKNQTQVTEGPLFRGFYRSGGLRWQQMWPRSIERLLALYPLDVDGKDHILKPLELRRFAAHVLVQKGFSLAEMTDYLGVAQVQPVIDYLGGSFPKPNLVDSASLQQLEDTIWEQLG